MPGLRPVRPAQAAMGKTSTTCGTLACSDLNSYASKCDGPDNRTGYRQREHLHRRGPPRVFLNQRGSDTARRACFAALAVVVNAIERLSDFSRITAQVARRRAALSIWQANCPIVVLPCPGPPIKTILPAIGRESNFSEIWRGLAEGLNTCRPSSNSSLRKVGLALSRV